MKTTELTGAALDWAVAKCERPDLDTIILAMNVTKGNYNPSTNWAQGGPIIEREKIDIAYENSQWFAYESEGDCCDPNIGTTSLIAAMRCLVASKLGDDIEVPKELTC